MRMLSFVLNRRISDRAHVGLCPEQVSLVESIRDEIHDLQLELPKQPRVTSVTVNSVNMSLDFVNHCTARRQVDSGATAS